MHPGGTPITGAATEVRNLLKMVAECFNSATEISNYMSIFKKTFLITSTLLLSYWIIAAFVFGRGQLTFHAATALVAAAYITKLLLAGLGRAKWFSIIIWPILVIILYK